MPTRSAYVTDLKSLQGECSANYLRLLRLMGELAPGESREVELVSHGHRVGQLCLKLQERAPYTSIVRVTQRGILDDYLETPRMRVHLYHDARMAEVTDFQRQRHFHGRYRYPNAQMHQPDEKLQLNRFLGEWLEHGLAHGHSLDVPELR
ncbi:DUF1249 domain-containing protein [Halomonas sp. KAO]|uniref:DUF1249 domain-containing protein n=1 Tax=unclassified Halomonas TaxID=2609666 RepID=UPI00189C73BB|nr:MULTISPECIES: DUF1249 domain-containing protein [unclassified Halomonas]MBF7053265.1 DUF1249 domain-containing protein [Halomonas sp. KAO]MDT0501014.1 DUF1249 domain-containing protein [Halomonas sp. PAR7]MDT0513205.1 DUF1249 domain-containing protein [Halomonas sp. LES1]MDT0593026.1 DUF1249 domain-containing protein [Halomonas sp. PAR8]